MAYFAVRVCTCNSNESSPSYRYFSNITSKVFAKV